MVVVMVMLSAIIGNAGLAQWQKSRCLGPVADAVELGAVVVVVPVVAALGYAYDGTADGPAPVGDIVRVEVIVGADERSEEEGGGDAEEGWDEVEVHFRLRFLFAFAAVCGVVPVVVIGRLSETRPR